LEREQAAGAAADALVVAKGQAEAEWAVHSPPDPLASAYVQAADTRSPTLWASPATRWFARSVEQK